MKRIILLLIICTLFMAGCTQNKPLVGGDRDENGCIGSAGYSWCEAKQKCLRTWEEPCIDDTLITNFEECEAAGYPVMESYPRQCRTKDDRTFTEEIDALEITELTCKNAGGNWNECSNKCSLKNQGIDGVACTRQCEALCECAGFAGFTCPSGFSCLVESKIPDALGYCTSDAIEDDDKVEIIDKNDVDLSCNTAEDCVLAIPSKLLECPVCDPYGCDFFDAKDELVMAVNKDWKPDCPPKQEGTECIACIGGISGEFNIECIGNICQKVIGQ